jgi:uncharacterized membrane protein
MRKLWPSVVAFVLATGFSVWAYPRLPDQVATHWGIDGEANGWSGPLTAVLMVPLIVLAVASLMLAVPRIDPRRESYEQHGKTYWWVTNLVLCFLVAVHVLVLGEGLGWQLPIARLVPVSVGLLLVLVGNVLPRLRPNWFMGIRTPWTLSSDDVWRRTHRLGGVCLVATGALISLSGFLGQGAPFYLLVGSVAVCVLVPVVYSWLLWRRSIGSASGARP